MFWHGVMPDRAPIGWRPLRLPLPPGGFRTGGISPPLLADSDCAVRVVAAPERSPLLRVCPGSFPLVVQHTARRSGVTEAKVPDRDDLSPEPVTGARATARSAPG